MTSKPGRDNLIVETNYEKTFQEIIFVGCRPCPAIHWHRRVHYDRSQTMGKTIY
jgi:hypothetical protein